MCYLFKLYYCKLTSSSISINDVIVDIVLSVKNFTLTLNILFLFICDVYYLPYMITTISCVTVIPVLLKNF